MEPPALDKDMGIRGSGPAGCCCQRDVPQSGHHGTTRPEDSAGDSGESERRRLRLVDDLRLNYEGQKGNALHHKGIDLKSF